MSIASELSRLQAAKTAIARSIVAKGVSVPATAKLDEYASLIGRITTDGLSYVSNGLELHLVGEDANESSWRSRVGSYEYTLENCTLGENYVEFNGTSSIGYCTSGPSGDISQKTLEIVFMANGAASAIQMIIGFPPSGANIIGQTLSINNLGRLIRAYAFGSTQVNTIHDVEASDIQAGDIILLSNYGADNVMISGSDISLSIGTSSLYSTNAVPSIGGRRSPTTTLPFSGKIYQVRLYSRILTRDERLTNYVVDRKKYSI